MSLLKNFVKKYLETKTINKTIIPGKDYIPSSGKVINHKEIINLVQASVDGWLTSGEFNKRFEKEIAKRIGAKLCITVNSGSSANLIAFSTLCSPYLKDRAIKKGDEVITVAAGFPTTVNPIVLYGAIPVFIDIKIPYYNIDTDKIENAISNKTKAIMIAHTLGNPFDLLKIKQICEKYNLWLVQDTCDAFGSKFDGKLTGYYGDIGTLSFYPAHHITTGEGGAVYFNDMKLKRIAESIRDWGRDCYCESGCDNTCNKRFSWQLGELPFGYDHKYTYSNLGYNLKMTDLQAACGVAQIQKLDNFIAKRNENFLYLKKKLINFKELIILPEKTINSEPSWFGFLITIKDERISRHNFVQYLEKNKIGTRLLFGGNLVKQPYFKNIQYKISENLNNTDYVMNNSFWVGVYPGLKKIHMNYISKIISLYLNTFIKSNKKI